MRTLFTIFCVFVFWGASAQNFNNEVIAEELQRQIAERPGDNIPFYILLQDRVDVLSMKDDFKARKVTKDQRSLELITALQNKARNTQGPILEYLKNSSNITAGSVRSYWITNLIYAEGNAQLIAEISRRSDVQILEPQYKIEKGEHTINECFSPPSPGGRENGHTAIKANRIWEQGYSGYGVVTMTIDTGVDGDHPSLRNNWRGLTHPGQGYTGPRTGPTDCDGHGSHVTGSMCGLDRTTSDTIGVAFNAQWIGSPLSLGDDGDQCLDSSDDSNALFQYALDPDGNAGTSDDVPIVINCSWGTFNVDSPPGCWNNTGLAAIMNTLEAAGIAVVWAAGNDGGLGAMTINGQASINNSLVNSFSIGNLNGNNANFPINSSSSRGPSFCNGEGSLLIKPEVSAPGTNIRSCNQNGTYQTISGTSMSAPHVSGAIALLSEKFPDAIGEDFKLALYNTCTDLGTPGEDNTYGMGIIDMVAASDYLVNQGFSMSNPIVSTDVIGVNMDFDALNCDGVINGTLEFENAGTNNLTSVNIAYKVTAGATSIDEGMWSWTGDLAQNQRTTFTIPELSYGEGYFTLEVTFTNPNNTADNRPLNNTMSRVMRIVTSGELEPTIIGDVNACLGSNALLNQVEVEGATEIEWYFNENATTPLGTGNTYLTNPLPGTFTLYVDALMEKRGGILDLDPANSGYTEGGNKGLVFDVVTPLTLKTVKVFSNATGLAQISLRDSRGNQLEFKSFLIPGAGEHVIDLNWLIFPGSDYRLVRTAGNNLAHTNGASFPYLLPDALIIKSGLDTDDPENKYHFFYDWNVEHKFACGRKPISLTFEPTSSIPVANFDFATNANQISFNNTSTNGDSYLWLFGDGTSSDLENPLHSYAAIGTYMVTLTTINADGCSDSEVMEVIVDEVTSISELEASNQIKVFPNPTKDRLNVQFDFAETQEVNLSVVDLLGRTLERQERKSYLNDRVEINLNNYSEGIYYLVFELDGIKVVKKVVKMK